jgi:nitrile hydratase
VNTAYARASSRTSARILLRPRKDLLIEKGVIGKSSVDQALSYFETELGPFNGAKIVARAWLDPGFKARLLTDTAAAIAELDFPPGMAGAEGEHLKIVENTPGVHSMLGSEDAPRAATAHWRSRRPGSGGPITAGSTPSSA